LIAQQVSEGRKVFIICPLIEETESLAVKAVTAEYERLSRDVFPNLRLGLLHGSMKAAEKDMVMRHFRDGELDILVATSVIEVGIDVPNATVMVIEDAVRFGLSQLHQFRGRVGRGTHQAYCYVLSADASIQAQERLEVFQSTDDGFRLAEEDLRLRGPGDFIGVRQSGMPNAKRRTSRRRVTDGLSRQSKRSANRPAASAARIKAYSSPRKLIRTLLRVKIRVSEPNGNIQRRTSNKTSPIRITVCSKM